MRNCSSVEQPACNAQHMLLGRIWPALRVLNLLAVQVAHIKGGNMGAVRAQEQISRFPPCILNLFLLWPSILPSAWETNLLYAYKSIGDSASSTYVQLLWVNKAHK